MVQSAATKKVLSYLFSEETDIQEEKDVLLFLDRFLPQLKKRLQEGTSTSVPQEMVSEILLEFERNDEDEPMEGIAELSSFVIQDAFHLPKFQFSTVRKIFLPASIEKLRIFSNPETKLSLLRDRYDIIYQRLMRNDVFSPPVINDPSLQASFYKITPITGLPRSESMSTNLLYCVFGLLRELDPGHFLLEDPTGSIEITLSSCQTTLGMFTRGCFVLAEGSIKESATGVVFEVVTMGFPPAESREDTMKTIPELKHMPVLPQNSFEDEFVVCLSDVHLDNPAVMKGIDALLSGFEVENSPVPTVIVFMGDFISFQFGIHPSDTSRYKSLFAELAEIINRHDLIKNSIQFIFIPGPNDPGIADVMPRMKLADVLVKPILENLSNVVFSTNPCKLYLGNKEIVLFRENLFQKLSESCVIPPTETCIDEDGIKASPSDQMVKTLFEQSHLSPLPLGIRPVYWDFDHALNIYPLPDVLVIADTLPPFQKSMLNSYAVNPGSFYADFSFSLYFPKDNSIKMSRISGK